MNKNIRALFDDVMLPNYNPLPVILDRGLGSRVWDVDNNEYIDFAAGIAVTSLGHLHPELVHCLQEQSQKLWHLSNVLTNAPAVLCAQSLVDKTFADKVFFCNSGAEANEAALKLARRYAIDTFSANKTKIIAFDNAFHGRTFFTVTAGGQTHYSERFGPKPGDIVHARYNDIESVIPLFSDETCAVIIEMLQGEGGVVPIEPEFLRQLKALCVQYNALLIIDEVQTGVGRTGKLYAYQHYNVLPDILTTAKALGNGFPIGAMLTSNEVGQVFTVGAHGSTYGGNPLACTIANKVLSLIDNETLLDGVLSRSILFKEKLQEINARYKVFKEIRGQGLLLGMELDTDKISESKALLRAALECNVLCLVAGTKVMRFTPSLLISESDILLGLEGFERAIHSTLVNN